MFGLFYFAIVKICPLKKSQKLNTLITTKTEQSGRGDLWQGNLELTK